MNLPKRDAKGRFISSKNKTTSANAKKVNVDLIGMANKIKQQDDEINRLNKEVNLWRIISVIFAGLSLSLFLIYLQVGY